MKLSNRGFSVIEPVILMIIITSSILLISSTSYNAYATKKRYENDLKFVNIVYNTYNIIVSSFELKKTFVYYYKTLGYEVKYELLSENVNNNYRRSRLWRIIILLNKKLEQVDETNNGYKMEIDWQYIEELNPYKTESVVVLNAYVITNDRPRSIFKKEMWSLKNNG